MKTRLAKTQISILLVAGGLLLLVGSFILAAPTEFYASNNIDLGANVSLLNELKAPAGMLFAAGLFMVGAVFIRRMVDTATSLAALIYLSYAITRLMSMILDGVPAAGLVQAAALEGIVGLACLTVFMIRRMPARSAA